MRNFVRKKRKKNVLQFCQKQQKKNKTFVKHKMRNLPQKTQNFANNSLISLPSIFSSLPQCVQALPIIPLSALPSIYFLLFSSPPPLQSPETLFFLPPLFFSFLPSFSPHIFFPFFPHFSSLPFSHSVLIYYSLSSLYSSLPFKTNFPLIFYFFFSPFIHFTPRRISFSPFFHSHFPFSPIFPFSPSFN